MQLSSFAVVHERGDAVLLPDDPVIQCFAGNQVVLACIGRQALMDYFRVPGGERISLRDWNLVVDRHLDGFKPIIAEKFERDEWDVYSARGQSYPKIVITLQDMQRSGYPFSMGVLALRAGFRRRRNGGSKAP
jgi:hypothetical protein